MGAFDVTWAELATTVKSSITDTAQQDNIVAEDSATVEGDISIRGIDTSLLTSGTLGLKSLLLSYGRALIFTYDASASPVATSITEGPDSIKYTAAGRGQSGADFWLAKYERDLEAFCRQRAPGRQPLIKAITNDVGHMVNG
jgi:hypothetical protein